jgi:phenylacetate-CoA ligase
VVSRVVSGRLFYPAYYRLMQPALWSALRGYRQQQWTSPAHLKQVQAAKRQALAEFLFDRVPWYREQRNDLPNAMSLATSDEAWRRLPVMGKSDIDGVRDKLVVAGLPGTVKDSTSGSSGQNFSFLKDGRVSQLRRATEYLGYEMAGAPLGDRRLLLWGAARDIGGGLFGRLKAWGLNQRNLLAYDLTEASIEGMVQEIERYQPVLILAYPNVLLEVARVAGQRLRRVSSLRVLMTSGEMLRADVRDQLERLLGLPVVNRYGSREFGNIAQQCHHAGGLHVFSDRFVVEVLDAAGTPCEPGDEGELIITDLDLRAMPLVRYRIGDRAIQGQEVCPCGRGYPVLAGIVGRSLDVVVALDGGAIAPYFFTHLSRSVDGVRNFRVIQSEPGKARIEILLDVGAPDNVIVLLMAEAEKMFGQRLTLEVVVVDKLPVTAAGKLRFIESTVRHGS